MVKGQLPVPRFPTQAARSSLAILLALVLGATAVGPALARDDSTPPASSELAQKLPAVVLPTMNSQGFVFELTSTYSGKPSGTPNSAPVYLMQEQSVDTDGAKDIAKKLGIEGDLKDEGNGTYSASGNGTLYVTTGLTQYVAGGDTPEGDLPADDQLVATAREWLRKQELLPANAGDGKVQAKVDSPARASVIFQPVTPTPLLSSTPSVTVTIGGGGTVLEASWRWADISQGDTYQLRPLEQAFGDVADQRSYLQVELPSEKYPDGSSIKGKAVYSGVSLAYASSGVPGEQQYLQPVYVFTGKVTPDGADSSFPITAYVPALVNSNQPVG